jgi:hypothetical protein
VTTVALLDRSRIVAGPGWSRWLLPPAAPSIHLAIGSAYAWSVFKIPLEKSLHISGTAGAMPFTIAIVMVGLRPRRSARASTTTRPAPRDAALLAPEPVSHRQPEKQP